MLHQVSRFHLTLFLFVFFTARCVIYAERGICCRKMSSVCPSLWHTPVLCQNTMAKHINFFHLWIATPFVFPCKPYDNIPTGTPNGAVKCKSRAILQWRVGGINVGVYEKNRNFCQYIYMYYHFISEMTQDRAVVSMELVLLLSCYQFTVNKVSQSER